MLGDVPDAEDVHPVVSLHTDPGVCWQHGVAGGQHIKALPPHHPPVAQVLDSALELGCLSSWFAQLDWVRCDERCKGRIVCGTRDVCDKIWMFNKDKEP